jgi:hypothetical protein
MAYDSIHGIVDALWFFGDRFTLILVKQRNEILPMALVGAEPKEWAPA